MHSQYHHDQRLGRFVFHIVLLTVLLRDDTQRVKHPLPLYPTLSANLLAVRVALCTLRLICAHKPHRFALNAFNDIKIQYTPD